MKDSSPVKLFFSQNFFFQNRHAQLKDFLRESALPFEEVYLPNSSSIERAASARSRQQICRAMLNTDYYLIMADRYSENYQMLHPELTCADLLKVPVIVIQPWSCWSIPTSLKVKATRILPWRSASLVDYLKSANFSTDTANAYGGNR